MTTTKTKEIIIAMNKFDFDLAFDCARREFQQWCDRQTEKDKFDYINNDYEIILKTTAITTMRQFIHSSHEFRLTFEITYNLL